CDRLDRNALLAALAHVFGDDLQAADVEAYLVRRVLAEFLAADRQFTREMPCDTVNVFQFRHWNAAAPRLQIDIAGKVLEEADLLTLFLWQPAPELHETCFGFRRHRHGILPAGGVGKAGELALEFCQHADRDIGQRSGLNRVAVFEVEAFIDALLLTT